MSSNFRKFGGKNNFKVSKNFRNDLIRTNKLYADFIDVDGSMVIQDTLVFKDMSDNIQGRINASDQHLYVQSGDPSGNTDQTILFTKYLDTTPAITFDLSNQTLDVARSVNTGGNGYYIDDKVRMTLDNIDNLYIEGVSSESVIISGFDGGSDIAQFDLSNQQITFLGDLNMSMNDITDISSIGFNNILKQGASTTFTMGTNQARISAGDGNLWIEAGDVGKKISFAPFMDNKPAYVMDMSNQINTSKYDLQITDICSNMPNNRICMETTTNGDGTNLIHMSNQSGNTNQGDINLIQMTEASNNNHCIQGLQIDNINPDVSNNKWFIGQPFFGGINTTHNFAINFSKELDSAFNNPGDNRNSDITLPERFGVYMDGSAQKISAGMLSLHDSTGVNTEFIYDDCKATIQITTVNDLSLGGIEEDGEYDMILQKRTLTDTSGTVAMKFVTDTSFGTGSNAGAGAIVLEPSGGSYAMNFYVTTGSTGISYNDPIFGIENDDKFNVYAPAEFHKDVHIDGTIYAKEEQIDSIVYNTINVENSMLQTLFYDMSGDLATEFIIGTGYGGYNDLSINDISLISLREDISNSVLNHPQDSDSTEIITTGSNPKELLKDISGKEFLFMTKNNISSLTGQNTYTKILGNINHLRDTVVDASNNGSIFNNVNDANTFSDLKYSSIYIYISTSGNGDDEPTDRTRMSATYKYNGGGKTSFTNLETGTPDISDSGYTHPYNKVYGLYHKLNTQDTLSNILTKTTFSAWRDNSGQGTSTHPEGAYYSINEIYILVKGAADIFDITGTKFQIMKQSNTGGVGTDNLFVVDGSSGNVGIRTSDPTYNLDIGPHDETGSNGKIRTGTINVYGNGYGMGTIVNGLNLFGTNDAGINFEVKDVSNAMRISQNGNVGIGTINPAETLDVSGSIIATKTNDISFTTNTDNDNTAYNMILEKTASSNDVSGTVGMKFVTKNINGNKTGSSAIMLEPSGSSYAMNFYVKTGSGDISGDPAMSIPNENKVIFNAPVIANNQGTEQNNSLVTNQFVQNQMSKQGEFKTYDIPNLSTNGTFDICFNIQNRSLGQKQNIRINMSSNNIDVSNIIANVNGSLNFSNNEQHGAMIFVNTNIDGVRSISFHFDGNEFLYNTQKPDGTHSNDTATYHIKAGQSLALQYAIIQINGAYKCMIFKDNTDFLKLKADNAEIIDLSATNVNVNGALNVDNVDTSINFIAIEISNNIVIGNINNDNKYGYSKSLSQFYTDISNDGSNNVFNTDHTPNPGYNISKLLEVNDYNNTPENIVNTTNEFDLGSEFDYNVLINKNVKSVTLYFKLGNEGDDYVAVNLSLPVNNDFAQSDSFNSISENDEGLYQLIHPLYLANNDPSWNAVKISFGSNVLSYYDVLSNVYIQFGKTHTPSQTNNTPFKFEKLIIVYELLDKSDRILMYGNTINMGGGTIRNVAAIPINGMDVVTKQYVDNRFNNLVHRFNNLVQVFLTHKHKDGDITDAQGNILKDSFTFLLGDVVGGVVGGVVYEVGNTVTNAVEDTFDAIFDWF